MECYSPGWHATSPDCGTRIGTDAGHNGFQRPVLKHGPRSLTSMRVFGHQTLTRNESERRWEPLKHADRALHRPILMSSDGFE